MSTGIQEEVAYIKLQYEEHLANMFVWKRPISHIVERNNAAGTATAALSAAAALAAAASSSSSFFNW